ncbi:hypothetical protein SAMN04487958_107189 [Vreelandella subterranea]|uniref:Phage lysis regulatory protein, LysB family n=1 Tax=Vreelandella subterranea TaxID=416874 RepID=A0A1H9URZ5_9GAMM|nr:hypothetical protein [Halomonas subterranea]SES12310.1 hypothetical protein SAMN04487958_107189 [Halomonas subterranea]
MIASLKAKAVGLVVSGLALASVFFYWQHVIGERDAYQAEAEHQRDRAEILQEHQQWQRQQIKTLNDAMATRDKTLNDIAEDMRASNAALEQLGEQNAEIRDWLDRGVPGGVDDWVRQLQQPTAGDGVRLPDDPDTPDE